MYKKLFNMLLIFLIAFTFMSCNAENNSASIKKSNVKLKVIVSFNPLYQITKAVGGDKVDIDTIIPPGTEAHDFEPTVKDLKALSNADIFVYNGLSMEPWAAESVKAVSNGNIIAVEASKGCNLIKNNSFETVQEHGTYDPHVWLSLKEAKIEALNIKTALIKADDKNKSFYEMNYKTFCKKNDKLFSEYQNKFLNVKNKNFITGHAAFAYLCRDFNLNQNSVEDVFASGEPSPQRMQDLIEYCKKFNVKIIFMEDMASPKVSETLASEVNAKVEKIDTIESNKNNKDYLQSMEDNLKKIYDSLK